MAKKRDSKAKTYIQFTVGMLWLLFLAFWFFSYAEGYTLYQNIAVVIASILVMGAIAKGPWMRDECRGEDWEEKEAWKTPGFRWRVSLSIVTFFGWMIFLVIWLFFYIEMYTPFQNIAIFIVSVLAFVAIMGAAWAPWGMKYGPKFEKMEKARKRRPGRRKR